MWAAATPPPPVPLLLLLGFLLGAAFGRWFSARKQVAQAVAAVRAELTATADARNVVMIGGRHEAPASGVIYDDLRVDYDHVIVGSGDDYYDLPAFDDDDHHRRYLLPGGSGGDDLRRNGGVGAVGVGGGCVGDLGSHREDQLEVIKREHR